MGIHHRLCLKLASPYVDVPHARCSTLWLGPAPASSYQSPVPYCEYAAPLFRFSPDDQSALEERFRGGSVCPSPSPRGIGSVGGRAQGRPFNFFLDAYHGCIYQLCRGQNGGRETEDRGQKTEDRGRREVDRYPPSSVLRPPSSVIRPF